MRVCMCVAVMVVLAFGTDAANMVMMPLLRRARGELMADDLRAVLAEAAIHRRLAIDNLGDAIDQAIEHQRMVAEIGRFEDLDLGMIGGDPVTGGINALHQHAGEEEIGEDDDALEAEL